MSLTVLSVAFWMGCVGPGSVGGAEQILSQIDAGLVRYGHRSLVIARPESNVAGNLIPVLAPDGPISEQTWRIAHDAMRNAIREAVSRYRVDIVHMHDMHFANYLPTGEVPTLVTMHLPLSWYKKEALCITRPNTYLHCVSRSQRELFPANIRFLPDIENGVANELLNDMRDIKKRDFAALLGRICPEKGFHVGLRAARKASRKAFLAGRVFPFQEHERYFAEQVRPELDSDRRYIGPVGPKKRRRVLASATCVIVPSLVPETSSLVAREAIASGTPVVAFAHGSLPDVISSGKTGFLVDKESDLPEAIRACDSLDPGSCRRAGRRFLSSEKMVQNYIRTYEGILNGSFQDQQAA